MINIIKQVSQIREKLERYGTWLEGFNIGICNGFNAVFNGLTLTLELLDYYYNVWASYDASRLSREEIESRRRENAERVIEITKWAFIDAMSIIEFSLKDTVRVIDPSIMKDIETRKSKGRKRKRVFIYLRDIVEELKNRKCLSDEVYGNWITLITIRNLVVHNNAIADSNKVLRIGDMEIHLRKGRMLKGKLDFFVELMDYAVDSYKQTLEALLTCSSKQLGVAAYTRPRRQSLS